MKRFKILVQNSNGSKSEREIRDFDSEESVKKFTDNLSKNTGFPFTYEYLGEVQTKTLDHLWEEQEKSVTNKEVESISDKSTDVVTLEGVVWEETHNDEDFPRGWHRRKEFVAKDGTVFRVGEEQSDEYRTLYPSDY